MGGTSLSLYADTGPHADRLVNSLDMIILANGRRRGNLVLTNVFIDYLSNNLIIKVSRIPRSITSVFLANLAGPSSISSGIPEPNLLLIRQVIETVQNIHITLLFQ